jgi:hypothetical protein
VIEIGSGVSTAIMIAAARMNDRPCKITCVDPYSPLKDIDDTVVQLEVRRSYAQDLELTSVSHLSAGDLLFVDSSHSLYTGSEVHHLYLELLPQLAPGVIVHAHDIFLPFMHHPNVVDWIWDWQETAFVAALLTENPHFSVLCCQSALHAAMPDHLSQLIPGYEPIPMRGGIRIQLVVPADGMRRQSTRPLAREKNSPEIARRARAGLPA